MNTMEILDPLRPVRAGGWKVDVSQGDRNGRVSSERFNRPDDERYLSLDNLWVSVKGRSERNRWSRPSSWCNFPDGPRV